METLCICCQKPTTRVMQLENEELSCVAFCTNCRNELPESFIKVISGKSSSVLYSQTICVLSFDYFEGTWTRENWETYPTVQRLRNVKQDDYQGMIYNPFNDSWGWF